MGLDGHQNISLSWVLSSPAHLIPLSLPIHTHTYTHSCALDPRITMGWAIPPFPQVFSLAGSTFSLPSTHIFGTPMGAVNPLLTQAESSHTGMCF